MMDINTLYIIVKIHREMQILNYYQTTCINVPLTCLPDTNCIQFIRNRITHTMLHTYSLLLYYDISRKYLEVES